MQRKALPSSANHATDGFAMMSRLVDPVFVGIVVSGIGLAVWWFEKLERRQRLVRASITSGVVTLFLCASPWFSNTLLGILQPPPTDLAGQVEGIPPERRAMVILAGGWRSEYAHQPTVERLDDATIARLLGGARTYMQYGGFGVVVVTGTGADFVGAMADFLVQLGVPRDRIILEPNAVDTLTNASNSAPFVDPRQVDRVVLVTSALHMKRSIRAFRRAGVSVVPAPVDYMNADGWRLLPSAATLHRTARATHEILGMLEW